MRRPHIRDRRFGKGRKHEIIEKPELVERVIEGEKVRVAESELVALPHLDDTPEELRREIDRLIGDIVDLDGDNRLSNRAIGRVTGAVFLLAYLAFVWLVF